MPIERRDAPKKQTNGRRSQSSDSKRWWEAPKGASARRLVNWAMDIETTQWPQRFANLTYYKYMTGRAVNPGFNYSMVSRPSSVSAAYGRSVWRPPSLNAMAQCDDVLANRVYKSRPFISVCPIAGDFSARVKSKKLTRWLDAAFYDLDIWNVVELCGQDSRMYGTAYVKVDVGSDKMPRLTRICDDEVLLDETECSVSDEPRTFGTRFFVSRDEIMAQFGDTPEAIEAINAAPSASLGFYFGSDLDVSDVIVLLEAWHLGVMDKPGRHVLAVGNYALTDEKYKADHFPIAKLVYKKLSSGWRGQGLAEQVLPLQRALERVGAAFDENIQRMSWPKVGIESSSAVNEAALAAKSGGTFKYTQTMPKFVTPEAITGDQFAYQRTLIQQIRERVGISDQAASGVKTPGLNSGLAIERQAQIDDGRHVELSLHLEDFVRDIGVLLIEAAEICKPSVTLPGRRAQQINWADVNMAKSSYWLRPFPMSSLPQSIAGRTEIIEQWAAQGRISKATQNRLEQVPDIDGYLDLVNAAAESVEAALDRMVEEGDYEPPTPFADLQDQIAMAQSRYLFEKDQGDTPRDRLDLILQYIAATQELIEDAAGPANTNAGPGMPAQALPAAPQGALPPMPGAGGGFGMQPPAGPAPVPTPYPLAPNLAPPVAVAA